MKILFILSDFFPNANANTVATYPFIEKLREKYDVDILCQKTTADEPFYQLNRKCNVYRFEEAATFFLAFAESRTLCFFQKKSSIIEKIKDYAGYALMNLFVRLPKYKNIRFSVLKRLIDSNDYYAVITVTSSFANPRIVPFALKKLHNKNCKWYQIVEDPWSEYIGAEKIAKKEDLQYEEEYLYKLTDKIFAFDIISNNPDDIVNKFKSKTVNIDFANLKIHNTANKIKLIPDKINLVFTGSLQDLYVRNPEFFYKMISEYNGDILHFHLAVYNFDDENRKLYNKYISSNKNVSFYYHIPSEECNRLVNNADILINISNLCLNQVPSKIYNYIGTCKPIVNFCKLEKDTSYQILKKYPIFLNINENQNDTASALKSLIEFAEDNCEKTANEKTVAEIYKKNLPENASQKMLDNF